MQVITNARIVLAEEVVHGTIRVEHGRICDVDPGVSRLADATDWAGDYLVAGLIDMHTDNLERAASPRGSAWPIDLGLRWHDAQCAGNGVTTVLNGLCVGDAAFKPARASFLPVAMEALARNGEAGTLRVDHLVHLRCELLDPAMPDLLAELLGHERVRLCSIMDHGPGGQFATLQSYADKRRRDGWSEREIETRTAELLERRRRHKAANRALVLSRARNHRVTVASHDDRTEREIVQNRADAIAVAEFPVTAEAAAAAHRAGMAVVAGAPNLVRGGSHSGNVAAAELIAAGTASVLASDFVPSALLPAVSRCLQLGLPLWRAMAMVTQIPARVLSLDDRGRIEPGLRADFVRLAQSGARLVPRETWCCGRRVF